MSDDSKVADLGNYIVIHLLRHTIYRTKIGFEENKFSLDCEVSRKDISGIWGNQIVLVTMLRPGVLEPYNWV